MNVRIFRMALFLLRVSGNFAGSSKESYARFARIFLKGGVSLFGCGKPAMLGCGRSVNCDLILPLPNLPTSGFLQPTRRKRASNLGRRNLDSTANAD